MKNLSDIAIKIEGLFDTFNGKFFEGKLEKPIITLAPSKKSTTYGHFTMDRVWQNDGKQQYEINLSSEFLNRPIYNICGTLLHEMTHLFCALNGIKDTSNRGVWHNTKFKQAAEEHGLSISKNRYGWSETTLSEETKKYIDSLKLETSLGIFRNTAQLGIIGKTTANKKNNSIRWVCPCCNSIIRSTSLVKVMCANCNVMFERQ